MQGPWSWWLVAGCYLVIVGIGLAAALGGPMTAHAGPAPQPLVRSHAGRVSLTAAGASLSRVLEQLAQVAGIELVLDPAVEGHAEEQSVTATFEGARPEDLLRRLLPEPDYGLVLIYSSADRLAQAHVHWAGRAPPASISRGARPAAPRSRLRPPVDPGFTEPVEEGDPVRRARLAREAVSHPDPDRRATALEELVGISSETLVRDTAVQILDQDRDAKVLEAALDTLGTLKAAPVDDIARFVTMAEASDLRIQALDILGEHGRGDARVLGWLLSWATGDADEDVRGAALMLLEAIR
jgi:hypothetical protein